MPPARLSPSDTSHWSFSAPKGVERACPGSGDGPRAARPSRFSAPKGVERACPSFVTPWRDFSGSVSVPRRALRGHAPHNVEDVLVRGFLVSVPRRALRGHAPDEFLADAARQAGVSVPRRALRGHAPSVRTAEVRTMSSFSAPKGVERACPGYLSR